MSKPQTTFVSYSPEGTEGDSFLGFLIGGDDEICLVRLTVRKVTLRVPRNQCVPLEEHAVRGGLIGELGFTDSFGHGFVCQEEVIDGILNVLLLQGTITSDEFIPITKVRFCDPPRPE